MKKNKLLNKQIIIKRIFFIVLVIVFLALLTGIVINSIQQNGLESFFRISIFETLIIIMRITSKNKKTNGRKYDKMNK